LPNKVRKMPEMQMVMNIILLINIEAHSLGS
jgi:hypothetical protein